MSSAPRRATPDVDWAAVRSEFPILARTVHGRPLAYLDNAASSQMPTRVIERITQYQSSEHANIHRGVHHLSGVATEAYELARERVGRFINAPSASECVFVRGATEALNLVMHGYGRKFLGEGDVVVLSTLEHHSNIVPWQMLRDERGIEIRVIPALDDGTLDFEAYLELLDDRVALVGLIHVSNALGTVNDVARFAEAAHRVGAKLVVDGAQSIPHMPVDVQALGADFFAFSGHKMCGPTGAGVLWGRAELLDQMQPFMGGGSMIRNVTFEKTLYARAPEKFEAGTPAIMPVIGLGEAVAFLQDIGMDEIAAREASLLAYAESRLAELDGVRVLGPANHRAAVASIVVAGVHPHDVGTVLDQAGVAIRAGHHCAQPTMARFGVPATVRASFAFYNNESDVDALIDGLRTVREIFG